MKQPSRVKSTISGNGMPTPKSKISPNVNDNGTPKAKAKKKAPTSKKGGKRIGGVKSGAVGKARKSGK